MAITLDTATRIAYAHREIETARALLKQISEDLARHEQPDIRDAFGRLQRGLQLGVPSGESSHRLYAVPWSIVQPVLTLHIQEQQALLALLTQQAVAEAQATPEPAGA